MKGPPTVKTVVHKKASQCFEDGDDRGRVVISGDDTNGAYSVMEWRVAPVHAASGSKEDYGIHLHRECEETFIVKSGSLKFLLGSQLVVLNEGDFVRVPKGVRHGYRNVSGEAVDLVVSFLPAGLERLFIKYRTDQPTIPGPGFIAEATRDHASEFGLD